MIIVKSFASLLKELAVDPPSPSTCISFGMVLMHFGSWEQDASHAEKREWATDKVEVSCKTWEIEGRATSGKPFSSKNPLQQWAFRSHPSPHEIYRSQSAIKSHSLSALSECYFDGRHSSFISRIIVASKRVKLTLFAWLIWLEG